MPSILTPKRRRITRSASRVIKAMAETWRRRTGAWSSNGMIGLSIRTGMLHQELERHAIADDKVPTGIIKVPRLPPTPPGAGGLSVAGGMSGFAVDLDDLRQGPPDLRTTRASLPGPWGSH